MTTAPSRTSLEAPLYRLVIITDSASEPFATALAEELVKKPSIDHPERHQEEGKDFVCGPFEVARFGDSEMYVRFLKTQRGQTPVLETLSEQNVYVVKQFVPPSRHYWRKRSALTEAPSLDEAARFAWEHHRVPGLDAQKEAFTQELRIVADAGPQKISAISPYTPYARADRKDRSGVQATAKKYFREIEQATKNKLQRYITAHLHVPQEREYFEYAECDDLPTTMFFAWYLRNVELKEIYDSGAHKEKLLVVATDAGAVHACEDLADILDVPMTMIYKRRKRHQTEGGTAQAERMFNLDKVDPKNRIVIPFDDILGSGGTLVEAATKLLDQHADRLIVPVTHYHAHPTFKDDAVIWAEDLLFSDKLRPYIKILTTNSMHIDQEYLGRYPVEELNLAPLVAEVMFSKERRVSGSRPYDDMTLIDSLLRNAHQSGRLARRGRGVPQPAESEVTVQES